MRKALETMVDRLGDLAFYFYEGGFEYLLNGVKELMFPHTRRLLEAKWRELKQDYGETAVAFSVRFRSLALGMNWNPEEWQTKFIESLYSPVMKNRVLCAATAVNMMTDDMAKYHDETKCMAGMIYGSMDDKLKVGISMVEEGEEEVCAIGNQGFGPTRGSGRGARGNFGRAMGKRIHEQRWR